MFQPGGGAGVVVIVVEHVEVLGVLGVGVAGDLRVAVDEGTRVERGEQPLVGIDDEAVGSLDAGEQVPHARSRQAGAAVRPVDVEPRAEAIGRRGRRDEIVDHPGVRRPRRGDDGKHPSPVLVGEAGDRRVERLGGEPAARVGRGQFDVGVHRLGSLGDGGVGAGTADDQTTGALVLPASVGPPLPARRQ